MLRYVRKQRLVTSYSLCKACGVAGGCDPSGCTTMTCLYCATPQCSSNGLGNGRCALCYFGFLPGWSRSHAGQACAYKGCDQPAMGIFPGKKRCCPAHGERRLKLRARVPVDRPVSYLKIVEERRAQEWEPLEVAR